MANKKPVKIKRYKYNHNKYSNMAESAKKIAALRAILLAIVGRGFFLGRPLINLITGKAQVPFDTSSGPAQSPAPEASLAPTDPPAENLPGDVSEPLPEKRRVYYYAKPAEISTQRGLEAAIAKAKEAGADRFVFDLKDEKGYVLFPSQNQYASQLLSETQLDIKSIAAALAENGLVPVARLYTFMDQMISTVERSTAVMYRGTDTRWLDSSAALGGKSWANPASQIMQSYIISLVEEIMGLGIKEFIFAGFSTPTGYSLDKRDFGTTSDGVLANMKSLIGTLKGKISAKGGYCSWQIEYSAVAADGSYRQYIVHPYQLGIDNFIITLPRDADLETAVPRLLSRQDGEYVKTIAIWPAAGQTVSAENRFVN